MYFWKIDKLKKDLLKKPLSENESFKYLFATLVLYALGTIPVLENNILNVSSVIITALITAIGVYYIYKCNKGASGNNFLQKYLSIGWVLTIRWTVLVMLPIMIVYYSLVAFFSIISDNPTLSEVIFFNLVYVSYFWLFGKHVKEVA